MVEDINTVNPKQRVELKTIKVTEELHKRLGSHIERYGESMNDIIERILNHYEKSKK
jgi:negative regulator of replication initiation